MRDLIDNYWFIIMHKSIDDCNENCRQLLLIDSAQAFFFAFVIAASIRDAVFSLGSRFRQFRPGPKSENK